MIFNKINECRILLTNNNQIKLKYDTENKRFSGATYVIKIKGNFLIN